MISNIGLRALSHPDRAETRGEIWAQATNSSNKKTPHIIDVAGVIPGATQLPGIAFKTIQSWKSDSAWDSIYESAWEHCKEINRKRFDKWGIPIPQALEADDIQFK